MNSYETRSIVHIVDPRERFLRVRQLMAQWHSLAERAARIQAAAETIKQSRPLDEKERALCKDAHAKSDAAALEFQAAAETYFMLGLG